jgi:hypothetical protein
MKKSVIVSIGFLLIILVACNKDKFQTKPQISIKSYNTKVVERNKELFIKFTYTDKEGDLASGSLVQITQRLNTRPLPPNTNILDTLRNVLDSNFPNTDKGELELKILNEQIVPGLRNENDTLLFRFALIDKVGNSSDTITSDKIVLLFK